MGARGSCTPLSVHQLLLLTLETGAQSGQRRRSHSLSGLNQILHSWPCPGALGSSGDPRTLSTSPLVTWGVFCHSTSTNSPLGFWEGQTGQGAQGSPPPPRAQEAPLTKLMIRGNTQSQFL